MRDFFNYFLFKKKRRAKVFNVLKLERLKMMIRSRNKVRSSAVHTPEASSWMHLYMNGDDSSFIAFTSLTRAAFEELLIVFSRHYVTNSGPGKKGIRLSDVGLSPRSIRSSIFFRF